MDVKSASASFISSSSQSLQESNVTVALVALSVFTLGFYLYMTWARRATPWEKYGVKSAKISLNITETIDNQFIDGVDSFGGWLGNRMLITRDVNLVKAICIKSFNNFTDRTGFTQTRSLFGKGIFFLKGAEWKRMRHILSPSFSMNRLKMMSSSIDMSAKKLAETMEIIAKRDCLLEAKHTLAQYTSGIIAKTGFGLATDCLGEEDNEFTRHCKNLIRRRGKIAQLMNNFLLSVPSLYKFLTKDLGVSSLDTVRPESDAYFNKILCKAIRDRKDLLEGQKPTDLLQSLLSVTAENSSDFESSKYISEQDVIAQSLLIMFAAFDTTSTALQMCFSLLALHPDIQDKVYQEIQEVVPAAEEDADSIPSHEQLKQLKYTQQVIEETLRLYPPGGFLSRMSNETMTFNMSNEMAVCSNLLENNDTSFDLNQENESVQCSNQMTIPAGTSILIPLFKIHRDKRHYANPDKFDPENFSPEAKALRHPYAFLPFGVGPRQCIGIRLAYREMKLAMVHVLRKVQFEVNELTEPKVGEEPKVRFSGVLTLQKDIKLAVRLR